MALAAVVAFVPAALAAPLVGFGDGTVVHGLSVQRDDGSSIDAYVEHATRDGRVADAAAVLGHLATRGLYDGSRLAVARTRRRR